MYAPIPMGATHASTEFEHLYDYEINGSHRDDQEAAATLIKETDERALSNEECTASPNSPPYEPASVNEEEGHIASSEQNLSR